MKIKLIQKDEKGTFLMSMPENAEIEVHLQRAYDVRKSEKLHWLWESSGRIGFEFSIEIEKLLINEMLEKTVFKQ